MRFLPHYLDAFNAAENGESARDAERRAMYARPDALPLPEEPARKSWLASMLGRSDAPEAARPAGARKAVRGE